MAYKLLRYGVLRLADMASVPPDEGNVDWQEYLKWVQDGNTPDPAETPEEVAEKQKAEDEAARERLIAEKTRELAVAESGWTSS